MFQLLPSSPVQLSASAAGYEISFSVSKGVIMDSTVVAWSGPKYRASKDSGCNPNRVETDRRGHILMSPPPAFRHSRRQGHLIHLLNELLPDGRTLPECPLSTADGGGV